MHFLRQSYLVAPEVEEDFVAELWAAGTLGVESQPGPGGRVRLDAFFPELGAPGLDLAAWRARGVEPIEEERVPHTDWLARWREGMQPFAVGERFFLDPHEPGEGPPAEVPAGRRLLRLPARAAFGTGSHESTRLALELLEETPVAGRRVLDVGTGTGVLAFAALALGAARAVGFDLDPAAPFHARVNARLNGLAPLLFAGRVGALRETPASGFDLALVNALPEEVLPELPALLRTLRPGAEMILSGVLAERAAELLGQLAGLSLVERARRTAGEWIAFRLATGPSRA
jgi:ribosomal protein L11 methyltransferase